MLSLNLSLLIQMAIFLAVMVTLDFFIFKPLSKRQETRDSIIGQLKNDLVALEKDKTDRISVYNQRIDFVKNDIQALRNKMNEELDRKRSEIIDSARSEAELIIKKEEEALRSDFVNSRKFLDSQTRQLSETIFFKIMARHPEAGR